MVLSCQGAQAVFAHCLWQPVESFAGPVNMLIFSFSVHSSRLPALYRSRAGYAAIIAKRYPPMVGNADDARDREQSRAASRRREVAGERSTKTAPNRSRTAARNFQQDYHKMGAQERTEADVPRTLANALSWIRPITTEILARRRRLIRVELKEMSQISATPAAARVPKTEQTMRRAKRTALATKE